MVADERLVDQPVAQDHVQQPGDERGVLARTDLEVHGRPPGGLGAAGVDDDQLQAALDRPVSRLAGFSPRYCLEITGLVPTNSQASASSKRGAPAQPHAVDGVGDGRARLVERGGREVHGGADGLHERARHPAHGGVGDVRRADVDGDGVRPVAVDDLREAVGDLVDGLPARDRLVGAVGPLAQAVQEALRVGVDLGQRPALGTGVALEQRRLAVAVHRHGPAVLDRHHDRAVGRAQPADARLRDGHHPSPLRRGITS